MRANTQIIFVRTLPTQQHHRTNTSNHTHSHFDIGSSRQHCYTHRMYIYVSFFSSRLLACFVVFLALCIWPLCSSLSVKTKYCVPPHSKAVLVCAKQFGKNEYIFYFSLHIRIVVVVVAAEIYVFRFVSHVHTWTPCVWIRWIDAVNQCTQHFYNEFSPFVDVRCLLRKSSSTETFFCCFFLCVEVNLYKLALLNELRMSVYWVNVFVSGCVYLFHEFYIAYSVHTELFGARRMNRMFVLKKTTENKRFGLDSRFVQLYQLLG